MQFQDSPIQVPGQFGSVYGLGTAQSVYSVNTSNRWVSALFGVILIGGAGLAIIYGMFDTSVQVVEYGPIMFGQTIAVPGVVAALLLFFGVLAAVNAFLNWNKSVIVYEKGLAYSDNKGVQVWGWQDVERFYIAITRHYQTGIYTGTTYLYTLQKVDGSRLKLDNKFKQIEALGRLITQKVAPYQYDRLFQKLRSGQTVQLGPISLNKKNIALGKKVFSWDEIEQVTIQKGYVSIRKRGGRPGSAKTPVSTIPNLDAFFAVVNQIVKVKTA